MARDIRRPPPTRVAYSGRELARALGLSRDVVGAAIRSGDLRASRLGGRTYTVLLADAVAWLRRHQVPRAAGHAESVVAERLAREAERGR